MQDFEPKTKLMETVPKTVLYSHISYFWVNVPKTIFKFHNLLKYSHKPLKAIIPIVVVYYGERIQIKMEEVH